MGVAIWVDFYLGEGENGSDFKTLDKSGTRNRLVYLILELLINHYPKECSWVS
jgi:hypothetical protein